MSIISRSHHHQTKRQTYTRYLDLARCAGLWNHPFPINSKGNLITNSQHEAGTAGLSWSELIRKFLKHNPERKLTAEIVTTELSIRLALATTYQDLGYDEDKFHFNDQLAGGKQGLMLPPRISNSETQSSIIKLLVQLRSVATGNTEEAYKEEDMKTRSFADLNYANIILALGYYSIGSFDQALNCLQSCKFTLPEAVGGEKYDLVVLVIGSTLSALMSEHNAAASMMVLEAYNQAIEVYDRCLSCLKISPADDDHRELHSWAEFALFRYCMLSKLGVSGLLALEGHRRYQSRSGCWPDSFRLNKRCIFVRSYLKLLHKTAKSQVWTPSPDQTTTLAPSITTAGTDPTSPVTFQLVAWRSELSMVERVYESLLKKTTKFPKSGHRNILVVEFCDLIFEGWKIGGCDWEGSSQAIEILFRANNLTFQAQRTLRHLIRLLAFRQDWEDVRANLELYFQIFNTVRANSLYDIVDKNSQSALESQRLAASDDQSNFFDCDCDSDLEFLETVTFGSRILLKFLNEPEQAMILLDRGLKILSSSDEAGVKDNVQIKARLIGMKGIASGVLAQRGDRDTRSALQETYLQLLMESVELNPTSFENLYHLAYAQAELRDIDAAVISARKAVEIDAENKSAWHLLGLITSASKEMRLALDIVEVGLANGSDQAYAQEGEDNEEDEGMSQKTPTFDTPRQGMSGSNYITSCVGRNRELEGGNSFSSTLDTHSDSPSPSAEIQTGTYLPAQPNSNRLTVPETVAKQSDLSVKSNDTHDFSEFSINPADEVESVLQLKLTKNTLIECMDGPEIALLDQQTLFAYFAKVSKFFQSQAAIEREFKTAHVSNHGKNNMLEKSVGRQGSSAAGLSPSRSLILKNRLKGQRTTAGTKTPDRSIGRTPQRSTSQSIRSYLYSTPLATEKTAELACALAKVEDSDNEVGKTKREEEDDQMDSRARALLQELWLKSAATFRRWGKLEECKGAIQEAERLDEENPEVWVQYALYLVLMDDKSRAIESLMKAVGCCDEHIPAIVHLSRILKAEGSVEVAESLLEVLVETVGWDVPEAWYLISEIYQQTGRPLKARNCLMYSLSLEESKPIRSLRSSLPRCL